MTLFQRLTRKVTHRFGKQVSRAMMRTSRRQFSAPLRLNLRKPVENLKLYAADSHQSVGSVAQIMSTRNVGAVLVKEQQNMEDVMVGIVTERDCARAIADSVEKKGVATNFDTIPISSIMTPAERIITLGVDKLADRRHCLEVMMKENVRHLPVMSNDENEIISILSVKDVVVGILQEDEEQLSEVKRDRDYWEWRTIFMGLDDDHRER